MLLRGEVSKIATFGRKPIFTRFDSIDAGNILEVMSETFPLFTLQRVQVRHLYDYYRGKQRIFGRQKPTRPEINNKIVVNHANEIVSFQVSYLLAEPIKYVIRSTEDVSADVNELNEFMYSESKETKDKELADWFKICGIGYRMVLPRSTYEKDSDDAPFELYTLNPEMAYVIKGGQLGEPVLAGVYMLRRRDEKRLTHDIACVYTSNRYFEVDMTTKEVLVDKANPLGRVPIFEYVNNKARLGAFETVETMLDAINALESNRLDATEQAVQALLMFKNCEVTEEGFAKLKEMGAVNVKAPQGVDADIKAIITDLRQADQQVLLDSMYNTVLQITGLPAVAKNVNNSSNNGAAFMNSGWYAADTRAKDSEKLWRESETEFLKLVLKICKDFGTLDKLRIRDFYPKFTRRNYEDILSKSQTLVNMLSSGIHPQYAIEQSGLFYDPTEVYAASKPYLKKYEITSDEYGNLRTDEDPDSANSAHNHDESTSSQKLPRGLNN